MKSKQNKNRKQGFSRQGKKNFFQKDMELELLIEDMGTEGEGIGKKDGMTFFVKDAVLGDLTLVKIMKMKKNYGYARLIQVLKPSPFRTEPRCPFYRQCGGCQIQALDYGKQLEFKESKVKNNLKRIGGFRLAEDASYERLKEVKRGTASSGEDLSYERLKEVKQGTASSREDLSYERLKEVKQGTASSQRDFSYEPLGGKDGSTEFFSEKDCYELSKEEKRNGVSGGELEIPVIRPIIGMEEPYHYRNKAQFPIGADKNGKIVTGFYAARSHTIIPNRNCFLGAKINEEILELVIAFMEENGISPYQETTGTGLVRHVLIRCGFATGEVMVCLVINGRELPFAEKLTEKLQNFPGMTSITLNVNEQNTNVILGDEIITLWGQNYITDYIGNVKYQISPLSFYQVNPVQTQKLYEKALEYAGLTGTETVWDLYCGIGTISLFLAQRAKRVYGVEVVEPAIRDARNNARINGIKNVEFFVGKAEEVLPEFYENGGLNGEAEDMLHPDVIVVDPPRKGCDEKCLETIVKMQPERVVYVSCDSATLARDLKYLCERGYGVREVQMVDMFAQTIHVETVCLLSKLHANQHIEVELQMDELDLTAAESKATYEEIKEYVLKQSGLKVSNLYIAQVKQKCGIIERENYNLPKSENSRQPKCPPEKEAAIREALEHFRMI